jgi:hypothetical protein
MATKNYSIRCAAPKRRNILAVGAFLRTGAGSHPSMTKAGPSMDEWDFDANEDLTDVNTNEGPN